jgi:hypothetical protein
MADTITKAAFQATIGTSYRVLLSADIAAELNLIQVRELSSAPGYETFALDFRGSLESRMEQGTYAMEQESIGKLDVFIVPVGADDKSFYYEAVFNRRVNQE